MTTYENDPARRSGTIGDLQARISNALDALGQLIARGALPRELDALRHLAPRPGGRARVVLHYGEAPLDSDSVEVRRDIKDDAVSEHWQQERGVACVRYDEVRIGYLPAETPVVAETPDAARRSAARPALSAELYDLVRQLDRAERSLPYVVLKHFRDRILVESRLPWADDPMRRQRVLSEAIERGLVRTEKGKVPNPRDPAFPPTTLELQRSHSNVIEALASDRQLPAFDPVPVRGEPLSETIIRERR